MLIQRKTVCCKSVVAPASKSTCRVQFVAAVACKSVFYGETDDGGIIRLLEDSCGGFRVPDPVQGMLEHHSFRPLDIV